MIIKRRCPECSSSFYTNTEDPATHCQNCTGDHDNAEQKIADAKLIEQVNARPEGAPQSVDLRTATEAVKRTRKRKAATDDQDV